jgi:hypothetical protein
VARLCPKFKSALKRRIYKDTEDTKGGGGDNSTESYSTTVPKMFPTVAASVGQVHTCSREYFTDYPPQ